MARELNEDEWQAACELMGLNELYVREGMPHLTLADLDPKDQILVLLARLNDVNRQILNELKYNRRR